VADAEREVPRALAHYIWPPQWVGEPPTSAQAVGDLILQYQLGDGAQARVFRDGMIAFRLGPAHPSYDVDFFAWLNATVRLMNAHLACLHAAMGFPPILRSAVVTAWTSQQVEFEYGAFAAMTMRAAAAASWPFTMPAGHSNQACGTGASSAVAR
jgi:hypothetical protein